jgi:hypothetical protein
MLLAMKIVDKHEPREFSAITTVNSPRLSVGSTVTMQLADKRWWRRLAFWLLRMGKPRRPVTYRVTEVTDTTFTIDMSRRDQSGS